MAKGILLLFRRDSESSYLIAHKISMTLTLQTSSQVQNLQLRTVVFSIFRLEVVKDNLM